MILLAIDTSCDETSVAIVEGRRVLSNVISSQVRYHKKYGGVVPFMAQRLHKERIDAVVELAVQRSVKCWTEIEAICVTAGPGLAPALQVGIEKARQLADEYSLPLYAVNHMAGHVASCFVESGNRPTPLFPALALLVSGGHTELVYFEQFGKFQIIGQTLDDALGEAYDKVAKMLGLGYPGGKLIAILAEKGNPDAYELPIPLQYSKDFNFSYSGLKNATRLLIYDLKGGQHNHLLTEEVIQDVAAVFQKVAQAAVMLKVEKALKAHPQVKSLLLAGGVAANMALRKKLRVLTRKFGVEIFLPSNLKLCTDNAAMIGVAAVLGIEAGQQPVDPAILDRLPGLTIEESNL